MLTFDGLFRYERDEGDSYYAVMPNSPKIFSSTTLLASADTNLPLLRMTASVIYRPANRMVTFVETSPANVEEQDGLYHLDKPILDADVDACQQNEGADHLLAFQAERGNHPRSPSRFHCRHVQPPRIAVYSYNEHFNFPDWGVQEPVHIFYSSYGHGHYSTDCQKYIAGLGQMISSFQALVAYEKAGVTDKNKNYILAFQRTRSTTTGRYPIKYLCSPTNNRHVRMSFILQKTSQWVYRIEKKTLSYFVETNFLKLRKLPDPIQRYFNANNSDSKSSMTMNTGQETR